MKPHEANASGLLGFPHSSYSAAPDWYRECYSSPPRTARWSLHSFLMDISHECVERICPGWQSSCISCERRGVIPDLDRAASLRGVWVFPGVGGAASLPQISPKGDVCESISQVVIKHPATFSVHESLVMKVVTLLRFRLLRSLRSSCLSFEEFTSSRPVLAVFSFFLFALCVLERTAKAQVEVVPGISTVTGNGTSGYSGDGARRPAPSCTSPLG